MEFATQGTLWKYKRLIIIGSVTLLVVILLALFTDFFGTSGQGRIPQVIWLLIAGLFLLAGVAVLAKTFEVVRAVSESTTTLEKVAESLEKIRDAVLRVNQTARLSEDAKAIAFRETNRQSLREAVFERLQQKDFESTYQIIDEIGRVARFDQLARQLRTEADRYRDATDQERENQVIAHIEKLLDNCQWTKASTLIERFIADLPGSDKAKAMRQRLIDRKQQRKKELLTTWDDAVKRQDTDRSLEILRELDMYLTPNEGLALQEAARDVFRTKLHNLGVEFSLAISEKRWADALKTAREIISGFPNSRMAEEIRERMDALAQRVQRRNV